MRSGAPRGAEECRRNMAPQSRPDPQAGFGRSTSGSVAVQVALLLLLVLGFIALGVEVSQLLLEHRKQQAVADGAAIAAASAMALGADLPAEARAVAASLGYNDTANDIAVTVANPPASGTYAGNNQFVEVKVERTFTPGLIQLFRQGVFTVRARALARGGQASSACLMALDTSAADAVNIYNGAVVGLPGCGVISNSTSNSSINVSNSATVNGFVTTAGDITVGSNAVINGTVAKHASAAVDPYAGINPGARPSNQLTAPSKPSEPLDPGWYQDGWDFGSNAKVDLKPGIYWVSKKLSMKPGTRITGKGVTIIIDGNYQIDTGSGTTIELTAPTISPTAGIVFYSSKNNIPTFTQAFKNGNTLIANGALYFPSQTVEFSNNLTTSGGSCTQVVARKIQIDQNAILTFNSSCTGFGTSQLGSSTPASLVE